MDCKTKNLFLGQFVSFDTHFFFFLSCDEKRHLSIKLLPKKAGRVLRSTLEDLTHKLQTFIMQQMEPANQSVADDSIDKEFQLKKKEVFNFSLECSIFR